MRLFSFENPGPEGTTWQSRFCASPSCSNGAGSSSRLGGSPVSRYQSVAKIASSPPETMGALEFHHELFPLESALEVRLLVVAAVDDVLRPPHERDLAVDDEDLAVVAEVGPLVLALERLHGEHEVPRGAHLLEPLDRLPVALHPHRRDMVEKHPHIDSARDRRLERVEERRCRLIEREDVELDMHEPLGRIDRVGHRVE